MRDYTRVLPVAVMLGMIVTLFMAGAALAAEVTLKATLAGGSAEDPPGDPDGSGTATITIDVDTLEVCWEITTSDIADAVASHIHAGAAGVNGGVVVGLDTDGFSGSSSGCTTGDDAAALQGVIDSPSDFYVNIHTADFSSGAIRGQLAADSPNTAMAQPSPVTALAMAGWLLLLLSLSFAVHRIRTRVS